MRRPCASTTRSAHAVHELFPQSSVLNPHERFPVHPSDPCVNLSCKPSSTDSQTGRGGVGASMEEIPYLKGGGTATPVPSKGVLSQRTTHPPGLIGTRIARPFPAAKAVAACGAGPTHHQRDAAAKIRPMRLQRGLCPWMVRRSSRLVHGGCALPHALKHSQI